MLKCNTIMLKNNKFKLISSLLFIAIAGTMLFAVLNARWIGDKITVWQFEPSAEISAFATETGMNDNGRFHFYATRPVLAERAEFNQKCPSYERLIVLGCYTDGRIFIYNVSDEQLASVRPVTAAHEMMHAVYDRLKSNHRAEVDAMLERQLERTTDERILKIVESYDEIEPGQRWNELHSIFATEAADLSPELEDYYAKYFSDRTKVVELAVKYRAVFDDLQRRRDALSARADELQTAIGQKNAEYETEAAHLTADIAEFNNCANQVNCFASQAVFNYERDKLVARQRNLNNLADEINALIEEYNRVVEDLNALGVEINKLNQSLDSRTPEIE